MKQSTKDNLFVFGVSAVLIGLILVTVTFCSQNNKTPNHDSNAENWKIAQSK
jgi:hypothetical protein